MLQGGDKNLFSGGLLGQIVATFAAFSEDQKVEIRNELQDLLFTYWADEFGVQIDMVTSKKLVDLLTKEDSEHLEQVKLLLDDGELLQSFLRAYQRLIEYVRRDLLDISSDQTASCLSEQLTMVKEAHVD